MNTLAPARNWGLDDIVRTKDRYSKYSAGHYKVIKFMQVNVRVQNVETGALLHGRPSLFELDTAVDKTTIVDIVKPFVTGLRSGALVLVTSASLRSHSKWHYPKTQLFVVTKFSEDQVNIVPLGGDPSGQYWRVSHSAVAVVPPESVTVSL